MTETRVLPSIEAIDDVVSRIETELTNLSHRDLVPTAEVADFLLDVRTLLTRTATRN